MRTGLIVYILLNIAGIGCLAAVPLMGSNLTHLALVALTAGAGVACTGMLSLLAFVEIRGRLRGEPIQPDIAEGLDYEPWYWQRLV